MRNTVLATVLVAVSLCSGAGAATVATTESAVYIPAEGETLESAKKACNRLAVEHILEQHPGLGSISLTETKTIKEAILVDEVGRRTAVCTVSATLDPDKKEAAAQPIAGDEPPLPEAAPRPVVKSAPLEGSSTKAAQTPHPTASTPVIVQKEDGKEQPKSVVPEPRPTTVTVAPVALEPAPVQAAAPPTVAHVVQPPAPQPGAQVIMVPLVIHTPELTPAMKKALELRYTPRQPARCCGW